MYRDDQTLILKNILVGMETYRWGKDIGQERGRFVDLVAAKQSQRDFEHILFQESSEDALWNLSLKHVDKSLLTADNPTLAGDLLYSVPPQRMADYKLLTLMNSIQTADIFCQEAHKQGFLTFLAVGLRDPKSSLQEKNPSSKDLDYDGHVFSLLKVENHLLMVDPSEMVQKR